MYRVIVYFTDRQDNDYPYHVGDTFPREGMEVSEERIKELSTTANRRKMILIKKIEKEIKAETEQKGKKSKE